MNSGVKQNSSVHSGVMLRKKVALAKKITKRYGMTLIYLNATIRSRKKILVNCRSQLFITMEKATFFWCFTEFRVTCRVFKHKHMHKFTWQVRYTKLAADYTIGNKKMAKIIKDIYISIRVMC